MSYEEVMLEKDDGIAIITLNRPQRLNAFSQQMLAELPKAFEDVRADHNVRVLVITGAGRAFSAGGDFQVLGDRHSQASANEVSWDMRDTYQRIPIALSQVAKPSIAAVNGPATGGGCDLALACDIRLAAETARFAESYVKVGLVPGMGGAHLLPRAVGFSRACELLYTGDFIDAHEAERIGLVSRVVPGEELLPTAKALAKKIAANPPLTLRHLREAIYASQDLILEQLLEQVALANGVLAKTEDHLEAIHALVEHRPPKFKGR